MPDDSGATPEPVVSESASSQSPQSTSQSVVDSSNEGSTPSQSEQPKPSKNARKKAARGESLPRDSFFSGSSPVGNASNGKRQETPKAFDFAKFDATASNYEETLNEMLDGYLGMRDVRAVVQHGDAAVIRNLSHKDIGTFTYYVYKGKRIEGSIGKALAFHILVLSDGVVVKLEEFIARHRGGVSFVGVVAIMFYLEAVIAKSNANVKRVEEAIAEQRSREEREARRDASFVEAQAVKVEPESV